MQKFDNVTLLGKRDRPIHQHGNIETFPQGHACLQFEGVRRRGKLIINLTT